MADHTDIELHSSYQAALAKCSAGQFPILAKVESLIPSDFPEELQNSPMGNMIITLYTTVKLPDGSYRLGQVYPIPNICEALFTVIQESGHFLQADKSIGGLPNWYYFSLYSESAAPRTARSMLH